MSALDSVRTGSVLIVDDDKTVRDVLCRAAATLFSDVAAASNGTEALCELCARGFDVLVTDLKMPGIGGLQLAEAARSRHPEIPIVIVSGYIETEDQVALAALGAKLLRKPFGFGEFRELLQKVRDSSGAPV